MQDAGTQPVIKVPPPPPPIPGMMDGEAPGANGVVSALLKNPMMIAADIASHRRLLSSGFLLLLTAVISHAVFGFAVGIFGGVAVAGMDIVKFPIVAVGSLLLCFPSLYVFSCVGGAPLSLSQTFMLGCSCLAMIGLLLIGLAPVAWLFAVSTRSAPFITSLTLGIWFVAILFASKYVGKLQSTPLFRRAGGIRTWFLILVLVTLQMTTTLRPMLKSPASGWWTAEKQFFFSHLVSVFDGPR